MHFSAGENSVVIILVLMVSAHISKLLYKVSEMIDRSCSLALSRLSFTFGSFLEVPEL